MATELTEIEAKIKAAREDGMRDGETNTKLNLLIAGQDKMNDQISQIRESLAPVQVVANRALDTANANAAAILQTNARLGALELVAAKAQDVKDMDKRIDAIEVKIAYAAGAAAIAGAALSYVIQQVIILAAR